MPTPTPDALRGREEFASHLKALRRERGLSQEALAHRAGMDRSFLTEVETCKHSLSVDKVYDLAEALDVHISAFFRDASP